MGIIFKMLLALLLIPAGIAMIVYAEKIVNYTGKFDFAERWFLSGGTYTFIKLLGLGITILSFMWVTGTLQFFLKSTLAPILPGV